MPQADDYQEKAVLCFVRREEQVLLIVKKRGLGAGKVNAPGGKLEPGESFGQAAIRETAEEVGLAVSELEKRGSIGFTFTDGYTLYVEVFVTDRFAGNPEETDEAVPFWCPVADIPYERMWSDDLVWLPQLLAGYHVDAVFTFDGDLMLEGSVRIQLPEPLSKVQMVDEMRGV
jgi:8-oxo-dGTP diphosphatase